MLSLTHRSKAPLFHRSGTCTTNLYVFVLPPSGPGSNYFIIIAIKILPACILPTLLWLWITLAWRQLHWLEISSNTPTDTWYRFHQSYSLLFLHTCSKGIYVVYTIIILLVCLQNSYMVYTTRIRCIFDNLHNKSYIIFIIHSTNTYPTYPPHHKSIFMRWVSNNW